MEETPISGLEELELHLKLLVEAPDTPLNAKLFDEVELQLTESNIPRLIPLLLPTLVHILLTYQNDPKVLASLSVKLLNHVPFTQALTLASEEALIQALQSPAPTVNLLAITVLRKAARSPGDTAILSIMQGVVLQYIRTWLSSPHVEVGEQATQALGDLLEVDCDRRISAGLATKMNGLQLSSGMPPGQGLLWRRMFFDKQVYELIFDLCAPQTIGTGEGQLDERQKTLAQARLLRVLPRLSALDFHTVTHTNFPEVETLYGVVGGGEGLLYFAAADMVNKEDMLMHFTLIDFFADFLGMMSMTELSKPTVDYLAALMKEAAGEDETMYKTLEGLAVNPETAPELVELLIKLNDYQ